MASKRKSRIDLIRAKKKKFLPEYIPHDYQREFHQDPSTFRAVVSGVGAGKTTLGCKEVIKWTQLFAGGVFVIGRLQSKSLKQTTQRRFFEICDPELVEHWNETDSHLWLKTPEEGVYSEILFMHLDEPGPLGSLDIDGWWIDEAHEPEGEEVPEETFLMLVARLRGMVGPLRGIITTNSGGKDWVWKWFFKEGRTLELVEDYAGWNVPTTVNARFLPVGYVEKMRLTHPDTWVRRFLEGSFDAFEGQIFTEFDKKEHTCDPFDIDEWVGTNEPGFDFGIAAPTAVVVGKYIPQFDTLYIHDLYYRKEADIKVVSDWMKDRNLYYAWADPSTANRGPQKKSAAQLYSSEGIALIKAPNDVDLKISTIHWWLKRNRIKIFNNLTALIDELSNYRWDPNKEDTPVKRDDHAVDALGYLLMSEPYLVISDPVSPGNKKKKGERNFDDRHRSYEEDTDCNPYADVEEVG